MKKQLVKRLSDALAGADLAAAEPIVELAIKRLKEHPASPPIQGHSTRSLEIQESHALSSFPRNIGQCKFRLLRSTGGRGQKLFLARGSSKSSSPPGQQQLTVCIQSLFALVVITPSRAVDERERAWNRIGAVGGKRGFVLGEYFGNLDRPRGSSWPFSEII